MTAEANQGPTAAELAGVLAELVARAEQLGADIDAAYAAVHRAADAPTRRAGYRLPDAAGSARAVAGQVDATAAELARLAARDDSRCPAEWGVCPEHGNTLRSTGGRSWCEAADCGRSWDYDRGGLPCEEPAVFEVRGAGDGPDRWGRLCAGHTLTARDQIDGVEVRPLRGAGEDQAVTPVAAARRALAVDRDGRLADWLGRARLARTLRAAGELLPAWSPGELLAVALILEDADLLAGLDYTADEALERLRYDIGQTRDGAAAVFAQLRAQLDDQAPAAGGAR